MAIVTIDGHLWIIIQKLDQDAEHNNSIIPYMNMGCEYLGKTVGGH